MTETAEQTEQETDVEPLIEEAGFVFSYLESLTISGHAQAAQNQLRALNGVYALQQYLLKERQCSD